MLHNKKGYNQEWEDPSFRIKIVLLREESHMRSFLTEPQTQGLGAPMSTHLVSESDTLGQCLSNGLRLSQFFPPNYQLTNYLVCVFHKAPGRALTISLILMSGEATQKLLSFWQWVFITTSINWPTETFLLYFTLGLGGCSVSIRLGHAVK